MGRPNPHKKRLAVPKDRSLYRDCTRCQSMNVQQYQILTEKGFDQEVIQVLEEVFQNKEKALVNQGDLEVTKLSLQKEIKEVELKLTKEIEEVRREIEKLRVEIKEIELRLTKEIHRSNLKMVWVMLGLLSPIYIGILSLALKIFL